jgi:hypothetical protein
LCPSHPLDALRLPQLYHRQRLAIKLMRCHVFPAPLPRQATVTAHISSSCDSLDMPRAAQGASRGTIDLDRRWCPWRGKGCGREQLSWSNGFYQRCLSQLSWATWPVEMVGKNGRYLTGSGAHSSGYAHNGYAATQPRR